jgi:serine/threonine protein kinase
MTEAKRCPNCQAVLPRDAPEGLCPTCLLLQETSTAAPEPPQDVAPNYRGRFTAPSPADLAAYFPELEIIELLGQGGMGAVYKARQRALGRLVALKILPPEAERDAAFAERFNREARALGQLNHPNIVTVYHFGKAAGFYYFIMEFIDGVNLRQLLRSGHLQPKEALQIVPQICDALQFAHEEGIVHRDIKPENILLDKKGRVKIADFGIAKLLGAKPAEYGALTGPWQVMGTVHYMAPEQMEKPLEVDHRADIYSLGVVFYELLTGQLPLGRFDPPSKKVQVDVRLDEVVLRALESEPERRYQHASDVKTDVESISSGTWPQKRWEIWWFKQSSGTRKFIKAVLILLFAGGLIAFFSSHSSGDPERTRVQIGFPDSWYEYDEIKQKGFHFQINYWTWSTLFGLIGFLSAYGAVRIELSERRRRRLSEKVKEVKVVRDLPPEIARRFGYEYRSKTTLWGLPLVHIATGIDPVTGQKRIAKGIIAMGDVAVGVIALGGGAFGGITFGGASVGLVSFGGMAIGLLFALGGGALGMIAIGGGAIGALAIGGAAIGYYAAGGGAWGVHAYGGNVQDPVAQQFFESLPVGWGQVVNGMSAFGILVGFGSIIFFLIYTIVSFVKGFKRQG